MQEDNNFVENENPKELRIQCPPPLSNEDFRSRLIEKTKNQFEDIVQKVAAAGNLDAEKDKEAIGDTIYKNSIASLYEDIAEARMEADNDRLLNILDFCGFYNEDEADAIRMIKQYQPESLSDVLVNRISSVADMQPPLEFLKDANSCDTADTLLALDTAFERVENFADELPTSTKSKIYFSSARNYRRLLEKDTPYASGQELNAIKHTLFFADEYKIINACDIRLNPKAEEKKLITIAYKKALKATNEPKKLYKIHSRLGDIYAEQSNIVGYLVPTGDRARSLDKAIHHYTQAVQYTSVKDERLLALRNLAQVQKGLDRLDDWGETKFQTAMLIDGYERCSMLIGAAETVGQNGRYLAKAAMKEIRHADITPLEKINLSKRIYGYALKYARPDEKGVYENKLAVLEQRRQKQVQKERNIRNHAISQIMEM